MNTHDMGVVTAVNAQDVIMMATKCARHDGLFGVGEEQK